VSSGKFIVEPVKQHVHSTPTVSVPSKSPHTHTPPTATVSTSTYSVSTMHCIQHAHQGAPNVCVGHVQDRIFSVTMVLEIVNCASAIPGAPICKNVRPSPAIRGRDENSWVGCRAMVVGWCEVPIEPEKSRVVWCFPDEKGWIGQL
jgi:hypothetical protein